MKRIFFAFGLLIILFLSYGCSKKTVEHGIDKELTKDTITIGLRGGSLGFHPWMRDYETTTMSINFNIFNSLVEFDSIFQITPALAISWENPDDLTWRFHLREDVKFHNGTVFTAEDVKYTIDFIKREKGNPLKDLLASVEKVVVLDDFTVAVFVKHVVA
ncbi:MAG: hypothetical protein GY870_10170 [archaeon]|nr:hypothetical protein [archaeon]